MKRFIILATLFLFFSNLSLAQKDDYLVTTLNAKVYTSFFQSSKESVKVFVDQYSIETISNNETFKSIKVDFIISKENFSKMDSALATWGHISSKNVYTRNDGKDMSEILLEIKYLQEQKQAYQTELTSMTTKDNRYYEYWEKVRFIDEDLFDLMKKKSGKNKEQVYKINVDIYDETYDFTDTKVSWVNMPGAEYKFLFIESPTPEISASQYAGYGLKYLFTKGKSYANIGALKEISNEPADPNRYKELFVFGFGQDFYSRYFGRGKNTFLNMYTGYNMGGIFATGETSKKLMFYLTPIFGIEMFKNKYLLIDTQVGYFIPFYENRNLRGLSASASFNFVF